MRNKEKFIQEAYPLIKKEFRTELNVVEDSAHTMNQTQSNTYTIPADFTISGKDETFAFEKKPRPATDDPSVEVEDYFYVGRGEK